jgi:ligand-binding sensor domain-containing protein
MRINLTLEYLLAVCLLMPPKLYSQATRISLPGQVYPFNSVEYLNNEHGLDGNEVSGMLQDKKGFLWFITDHALNRFDGYNFRSYGYNPSDSHSISTGWYYGVIEQDDGTIWIPSHFKGLYSFDPSTEKFHQYELNNGSSVSVNKAVYSAAIAGNSVLWVVTAIGLSSFDLNRKQTKKTFIYGSAELPFHSISCLVYNNSSRGGKRLWLVHENGVASMDAVTGKLLGSWRFPFTLRPGQLNNYIVATITDNSIWLGSDDYGIYGFNIGNKQFVHFKTSTSCRSFRHIHGPNHTTGYYPVREDRNGNLWTTNDNNEIVHYNLKENRYTYFPIPAAKFSFLDLPPYVFQDVNEDIWFCTGSGLVTVKRQQKKFSVLQHDPQDPRSVSGNFIYGIHRAQGGKFYVGASGIDIYDKNSKTFSRFNITDGKRQINTEGAWIIYEDTRGRTWFTGNFGLIVYEPRTGKSKLLKLHDESGPVTSERFVGIIEDNKGRFWACNDVNGLYLVDPQTGKVRIINHKNAPGSVSTSNLVTIYKDSKGMIYIGAWEGGFITFDPDTEKFKTYHHQTNNPNSVSNESVHLFREGKNGLIWFGTLGGGINVFNPQTEKFRSFTTDDGLIHNSISSFVEDKNGNYWVGTRGGGISCFTPPQDPFAENCRVSFRNFNLKDGLPSTQFNMSSSFCDEDGTLYFGTRGAGIIYFHPKDLKDNDFKPPVYLTGFRMLNKELSAEEKTKILNGPIEFAKEISLSHRQNTFSFSFAALNYVLPENNKYAYKLEGYDKDWITTDASMRFATYTNLSPGSYTFKVKGSNNDGVWNETPAQLKITIKPPFWKTVWFTISAGLVIILLVYTFYRYRISQILLLQRIRNKIAADLHDDIGSTINSISVYSEVAKKDGVRKEFALNMIGENSRRIVESMSDIVWSINPENDHFDKIIFRMRSTAYNLLKAKKIDCTFKTDESLNSLKIPMQIRRNFYLIFKESLNNLVKYSMADRASILLMYESRQVTLIVRDNGVGFDLKSKHNGNGLNNIRRRADEMKGKLTIESAFGSGTTVELNFRV